MDTDARPYVRWWWFSGPINTKDINEQLDWLQEHGFGGVELAWVYPQPESKPDEGPRFLDDAFQACIAYTQQACAQRNLGCDLTFGTLWPFCGTFIPQQYRSKRIGGFSNQTVNRSWESRYDKHEAGVLDHLDEQALRWYAQYLADHGFRRFAQQHACAFFCDSWEVDPHNLGFSGFQEQFVAQFGYAYDPHNATADQRFDYRHLISNRVLDHFYRPYSEICHQLGAASRVQCHGAPTDILAAYALSDIPESETLLFDPKFALLAASAATFHQKPMVSSESFSCIYGWVPSPASPPYLKQERVEDLRCVADAQFAWGVNRVVWHGMPSKQQSFYATVEVSPDSSLAPDFTSFNAYLQAISQVLMQGQTVSRLTILLPLEDQWMDDELPEHLRKPSSQYWWELQELDIPDELLPYRPLWFSSQWLSEVTVLDGKLWYQGCDLGVLYCPAKFLLFSTVQRLAELAELGAPLLVPTELKEPGTIKHAGYAKLAKQLSNASAKYPRPVLQSEIPLDFWCRQQDDTYHLFIAHPQMRNLRYPLAYGYASQMQPYVIQATFFSPTRSYPLQLDFPSNGSLLFAIHEGTGEVRKVELTQIHAVKAT